MDKLPMDNLPDMSEKAKRRFNIALVFSIVEFVIFMGFATSKMDGFGAPFFVAALLLPLAIFSIIFSCLALLVDQSSTPNQEKPVAVIAGSMILLLLNGLILLGGFLGLLFILNIHFGI